MKRIRTIIRSLTLILFAAVLVASEGVQVVQAGDEEHKGDLYYYTQNGIIFYEGGTLHCSDGNAITGGAAGMLQAQKGLDRQWIPVILNEAKRAGADPIAMASLLFWENRGFPKYGDPGGGSDSIGRGPWQITKGTWPASAGPYATGVIDPLVSTAVAADLVKSWGGVAGSPIGSIDQDFSKNKNIPSMATLAKNYNAGRYTWREPGVATYRQAGRVWRAPDKNWNNVDVGGISKADVIDDYIIAMTYAYYLIATGESLPKKGELNNKGMIDKGLANVDKIKNFKITDGGNVANECGAGEGNGNLASTAAGLAWPNRKYAGRTAKSAARPTYQQAMPKVHGGDPGNDAWTDCGVFVSTVMRFSGGDPKYALRGTSVQLSYVRKNPDKYEIYENLSNTGQLKPGDIFIVAGTGGSGHTFMHTGDYKGDDGKKYDGYSASWGSRVPMANHTYFDDSRGHYTVARLKQTDTTGGAQP